MIKGNCHCGSVSWTYPLELESVTACNCTLCRKYGALWAYGFLTDGITTSGETKIYSYRNQVSNYHFCVKCGGLSHYIVNKKDEHGKTKIAVNMRLAADPQKIMNARIDHFDGFDTFEDMPSDGKTIKDLWY